MTQRRESESNPYRDLADELLGTNSQFVRDHADTEKAFEDGNPLLSGDPFRSSKPYVEEPTFRVGEKVDFTDNGDILEGSVIEIQEDGMLLIRVRDTDGRVKEKVRDPEDVRKVSDREGR